MRPGGRVDAGPVDAAERGADGGTEADAGVDAGTGDGGEISAREFLDGPVELEVVVGRDVLRGHGGEANRRRELRRLRAEPVDQLADDLGSSLVVGHRVEGPGAVSADEADHQAGRELARGTAAVARVRDEVAGEDRDRLSGQPPLAPERVVVDEPDLPHRALGHPLLELGAVGRQDRVEANEGVAGARHRHDHPLGLGDQARRGRHRDAPLMLADQLHRFVDPDRTGT